jgi:hypothetical protein
LKKKEEGEPPGKVTILHLLQLISITESTRRLYGGHLFGIIFMINGFKIWVFLNYLEIQNKSVSHNKWVVLFPPLQKNFKELLCRGR